MKLQKCLGWLKGKAVGAWGLVKKHYKCFHLWKGLALITVAALAWTECPIWDWVVSWGSVALGALGFYYLLKCRCNNCTCKK